MNINQLINHARDSDYVLDQIIKTTSEMEVQHILFVDFLRVPSTQILKILYTKTYFSVNDKG